VTQNPSERRARTKGSSGKFMESGRLHLSGPRTGSMPTGAGIYPVARSFDSPPNAVERWQAVSAKEMELRTNNRSQASGSGISKQPQEKKRPQPWFEVLKVNPHLIVAMVAGPRRRSGSIQGNQSRF